MAITGKFEVEMAEKESKKCNKHGKYNVEVIELFGSKHFLDNCPFCAAEKKASREKEEMLKAEKELVAKKERYGVSKRLINASFDDYICKNEGQKFALAKFAGLAKAIQDNDGSYNIIAIGGVGTGKTHLASATINYLVDRDIGCRLITAMAMIRKVRESWGTNNSNNTGLKNEQEWIEYFSNVRLLIIDEVGVQANSDSEKNIFSEIIDGRYRNMLPTVLISNLTKKQLLNVVSDRVIDRLREGAGTQVVFDWSSARGQEDEK